MSIQSQSNESPRVQAARLRLEAANLRVLAASQRSHGASYARQAEAPSYAGQSAICADKQAQVLSFADRTAAQADLLEARAAEIANG